VSPVTISNFKTINKKTLIAADRATRQEFNAAVVEALKALGHT